MQPDVFFDMPIHRLFEITAEKQKDKPAITFNYSTVNYGELNEMANCVAHELRNAGVGPNDVVGLMLEDSIERIISLFGILKAGGACLPIDSGYPADRKRYMLENSEFKLLLTEKAFDTNGNPSYQPVLYYDELDFDLTDCGNPDNQNSIDDLLYLIYTSGSTGQPKGVMIEHRNILNLLYHSYYNSNINFSNNVLQFASFSFDVAFQEIFSTLIAGGHLYLTSPQMKFSIPELFWYIETNQIEVLFYPTAFLKKIFNGKLFKKFPTTVKHIITAGEQLVVSDVLRNYLKGYQVQLHNQYGPSETHVVTTHTLYPYADIPVVPPIGKPISNTNIYILNDQKEHVQNDDVGELYISGDSVGRGYMNQQKETKKRFVVDPFSHHSKMYGTGDLAKWLPDGSIQYMGRKDHQVKVKGYRIETGEIEYWLGKIGSIREAAVVVQENSHSFEKQLIAFYVSDEEYSPIGMKEQLRYWLPVYMIPRIFKQVEQFPMTLSGKIDKKALMNFG
ncbi:MAG: amino acid adenylation domain-containing protein [Desulfobacteraceae bacterium]|nr:amino acid adenylation domain-containing protein [Desulfobacteraceae bacterium]